MDFYSAVNQRRTVRDFQDKEVSKEIIYKVLDAGLKPQPMITYATGNLSL